MFHDFVVDTVTCRTKHLQNMLDDVDHNLVCSQCAGPFLCHLCPAEFQVDTKDFGNRGVALVITRWLDLGDGSAPFDPSWTSRVVKGHYPRRIDVPVPLGSIQEDFQHRLDDDELLTPEFPVSLLREVPFPEKGRESLLPFYERNEKK
ncbi:hypothetical protein VF21_00029 [Pseudogymnoascus sp. 05NY08]|nr:hypothetical protein VF21_00266 [Pseudogymnoascus sp. 05NY08]OBT80980.1 hypothetical protein VF21_00029 [Pseudogymnoascus sp. 05NY08]